MQLKHVAFLDEQIQALNEKVAKRLEPWQKELEKLDELPGVALHAGQVILGVCGVDMRFFPGSPQPPLTPWGGSPRMELKQKPRGMERARYAVRYDG